MPALARSAAHRLRGVLDGTVPHPVAELALVAVLYGAYSVSRIVVTSGPEQAMETARAIVEVERVLHLHIEQGAVQLLLGSQVVAVVAGYMYAALHYTVTPAVLVWLYRVHPHRYRSARRVLALATVVALVCYWLVPTAPPRLLSPSYPDVMALTADWGWWGAEGSAPRGLGSLTNQYAALPSMHVGWAVWSGLALALLARRRVVRVLGAGYPVVVSVVVVATGNHWVLDVVAGAVVVALCAFVVLRWLPRPGSSSGRRGERVACRTTRGVDVPSVGSEQPVVAA